MNYTVLYATCPTLHSIQNSTFSAEWHSFMRVSTWPEKQIIFCSKGTILEGLKFHNSLEHVQELLVMNNHTSKKKKKKEQDNWKHYVLCN